MRVRSVLLFTFILGAAASSGVSPAAAQNYPWCAVYSMRGGGTNCGFETFEQCMATVSGIGGFCTRNTMYVPEGGGGGYGHRHRHHMRHSSRWRY